MAFSELCRELIKEPTREPGLGEKAIGILKNVVDLASSLNDPLKVLSISIAIITDELAATNQKLDKLIRMHYDKGVSYLRDAHLAQEELNEKISMEKWQDAQTIQAELKHVIRNALDAFQSAAKADKPLVAAKAEFFVGVCYDFLNLKEPALQHYKGAYVDGQKEILKKLAVYLPIQHMTLYRREAYEKYEKIRFRMRLMIPFSLYKYALGGGGSSVGARGRQICMLTEKLMNQYLSYAMSAYILTRIPDRYPLVLPPFLFPKEEVEQINNELTMDLVANPKKNAENLEVFIKAFLSKPFPPIPTNQLIASLYNFPPMREMGQCEAEFLKPLSELLSRRK